MKYFLTGFMGVGKSYIGKRLADKLSMPFIDLDEAIEQKAQCSISDIFEHKGQDYFRTLEAETLRALSNQHSNVIVSTGGGTPCFCDNPAFMKSAGLLIYLKAPVELLLKRLQGEQEHRPLLRGKSEEELRDFIADSLKERTPFYENSDIVYHIKSADQAILKELYMALRRF